jgi:hypothetical protein
VTGLCVLAPAGDDVPGLGLPGVGLTDPVDGGDDGLLLRGGVVEGPGDPLGDGLCTGALG